MRTTPFHARTSALSTSFAWKEWAGYAAVRAYDAHSEREYFALRHGAGVIDVSPLYKYEVSGPHAAALLARMFTRDIGAVRVGQVVYSAMADERGQCLDDGTVARLTERQFRVTTSEPWMHWWHRHARGLDVQIEDSSARLAALAVQGPLAREILKPLVGWDLDKMRFFRVKRTTFAGRHAIWISRTGYTGDLGYELWIESADALPVLDALLEHGAPRGLEPVGLDALDVARIEAGFVLQGVDYVSARSCLVEGHKSTPDEAGLGWTVDLDREPFVGAEAIRAERARGPEWALVGLELDWGELEALYATYGLPPHLAPAASRVAVPVYDPGGHRQVGQVTSSTWSPLLKRYLALAQVYAPYGRLGTKLRVEHTPEFERRQVTARVVETPFFDPPRKRGIVAPAAVGSGEAT
jgi:aminomethyltransferase